MMFTPKETKCPKCGNPYWMQSGAQKLCPDCASEQRKAYQREYYRKQKAKIMAKIRAKSDRIREKNHPSNPDTGRKHPCPYCGHTTRTAYCASCHYQGFDNVHRMFGITNGWDRRKKQNLIVPGWRGRECVGFNSALSRRSE